VASWLPDLRNEGKRKGMAKATGSTSAVRHRSTGRSAIRLFVELGLKVKN